MHPTSQQDITAVVVNYGSLGDTTELVKKFQSQVNNILVVDNSNEIDASSTIHDSASVITPLTNIGFGAAANLAAKQADTRWLLIVNPDVRLTKNCLKHLLDASLQLNAPLCGPRFYWDDACTLQLPPALGHPLWLLSDRHLPNNHLSENPDLSSLAISRHERFWDEKAPFSEPVLSGACLLVDNFWFRQNNMTLFDEDFFLYYEDTDLCGRLMRKGVMPICVPQATAIHYWNQSAEPPESKSELMRASEKIFLEKYYPNGAPALPRNESDHEYIDLGVLSASPALLLPGETRYLDIGTQNDFIVFIRAVLDKPAFTFSRPVWRRIRDGEYYFRALDRNGKFLQFWRWQKKHRRELSA